MNQSVLRALGAGLALYINESGDMSVVLVPEAHSPLGFPWGQQRNPPWRGHGLSRCHLECWSDANCSQRMMSPRDNQCQTHPWLRDEKRWEEFKMSLHCQMPNAGERQRKLCHSCKAVKSGPHLAYQFSTDLRLSYPCYLESQWVQNWRMEQNYGCGLEESLAGCSG